MFLIDRLNHWADQTPEAIAIAFEGEAMTFEMLRLRSKNIACWLADTHSVRPGDRVAYLGLNHPDQLALFFACVQLGAMWTPLNTRLALEEYRYLLKNSQPALCLYDDDFSAMVSDLNDGDVTMLHVGQIPRQNILDNPALAIVAPDDPLLLVYTSGTTGRPKGVVLSHRAVAANIENSHDLYAFKPGDRVQVTLPLFHVGGLCILLLPALTHGSTIYLHRRFDPVATLAEIETSGITSSLLVPAQMAAMMVLSQWENSDFSSLKFIAVGSSMIPKSQIEKIHAKGVPVSQVYGATETGPGAIGLPIANAYEKVGSAGTAMRLVEIDIRNSDRSTVRDGDRGDIWVKGPNILSNYWRSEEETQAVLIDGWYNTDDVGYRDAEGFYWIVDRSKDVIISGGENIYPAEVERVALEHLAIQAVAVVGTPDPRWGETPVAAVEVVANASFDKAEFLKFFHDRLARYKQPKRVLVFDQLPRNSMGKIEKSALRDIVSSD